MDILNYNPTFVSWETLDSRYLGEVEFRHNACLIEKYCVTLSAKMKGVLEPDEFRPIIASSLLAWKLRKRALRQTALTFVVLVAFAILLAFLLPVRLPRYFTYPVGPLSLVVALPTMASVVVLGAVLVSVVAMRKLAFAADRWAADIVSAVSFLDTLDKIANTTYDSSPPSTFSRGPIPVLPDIQTRIARLQSYSQMRQDSVQADSRQ